MTVHAGLRARLGKGRGSLLTGWSGAGVKVGIDCDHCSGFCCPGPRAIQLNCQRVPQVISRRGLPVSQHCPCPGCASRSSWCTLFWPTRIHNMDTQDREAHLGPGNGPRTSTRSTAAEPKRSAEAPSKQPNKVPSKQSNLDWSKSAFELGDRAKVSWA